MACCLQYVDRAHDVSCVGLDWQTERMPHQWLSGHVDNNFRSELVDFRPYRIEVTDIDDTVFHALGDTGDLKQSRVSRRLKSNSTQCGPHGLQPQTQPTALESRVPSYKNTLTPPKF